jgi:hypothetical protein
MVTPNGIASSNTLELCGICNGQGIISTINGKPPVVAAPREGLRDWRKVFEGEIKIKPLPWRMKKYGNAHPLSGGADVKQTYSC